MSSRVFFISTLVFVGCLTLFLCEMQGFRVFDHSMWGVHSKESGILSPPELLVFFGGILLGLVAGVIVLVSSAVWLIQRLRYTLHRSRSA